jgi:apoptosis-inducing factor 3
LINSGESDVFHEKVELNCDIVLLATGVTPNSEFLHSVITLENKQAKCDAYLCTSDPDIFTAGDVSSLPSIFSGERMISPHYINAEQQGSLAALNMLGKNIPYDYTPSYSTIFFDKILQFVGTSEKYEELVIDGNLSELTFRAYYFKNKKLIGFASMNSPNTANVIYEILRSNYLVSPSTLRNGDFSIEKIKEILNRIPAKCTKIDCVCNSRL